MLGLAHRVLVMRAGRDRGGVRRRRDQRGGRDGRRLRAGGRRRDACEHGRCARWPPSSDGLRRLQLREYGIVVVFLVLFVTLSAHERPLPTRAEPLQHPRPVGDRSASSRAPRRSCHRRRASTSRSARSSASRPGRRGQGQPYARRRGRRPRRHRHGARARDLERHRSCTVTRINSFIGTLAASIVFVGGSAIIITAASASPWTTRRSGRSARTTSGPQVPDLGVPRVRGARCGFVLARTRSAATSTRSAATPRRRGSRDPVRLVRMARASPLGPRRRHRRRAPRLAHDHRAGRSRLVDSAHRDRRRVLGGTSILGGEGAIWRGVLGVLLLALISNGFNLLGIDTTYQQIVQGGLILTAVAIDSLSRRATWHRARRPRLRRRRRGRRPAASRPPAARRGRDGRAARGRRPRRQPGDPRPVALLRAVGSEHDWGYRTSPAGRLRGAPAALAARQGARRLERAQRDDLHPRPPQRLRRLGGYSATRAGATTTCCRSSSARRTSTAGRAEYHGAGGPLRVLTRYEPHPVHRRDGGRRAGGRHPVQRRPQRRRASTASASPAERSGTASARARATRVPRPGRRTRRPRVLTGARARRLRLRGRALRGRRGRAGRRASRSAPSARSSSAPARSSRPSCCCSPASAPADELGGSGSTSSPTCPASGATCTTTCSRPVIYASLAPGAAAAARPQPLHAISSGAAGRACRGPTSSRSSSTCRSTSRGWRARPTATRSWPGSSAPRAAARCGSPRPTRTPAADRPAYLAVRRRRRRAGRRDRALPRDRPPGALAEWRRRELYPGPGVRTARSSATTSARHRDHLPPPGRHLQDGRRRGRGRRPRSCAFAASRACASPTPRSCRS